MGMPEYPSWEKGREESDDKKKSTKLAKTAKNAKRSIEKKVTSTSKDIGNYILEDIIKPSAKEILSDIVCGISDAVKDAINASIFGEDVYRNMKNKKSKSYSSMYKGREDHGYLSSKRKTTKTKSAVYNDVPYQSRGECEVVLSRMEEILSEYEFVTVVDLIEIIEDVTDYDLDVNYTDADYGWASLKNVKIERIGRGQWNMTFPKALPID